MNNGYLSWHDPIDRGLLETLGQLVERYNRYLEETQGTDQLDIQKELQDIIEKLKDFLPT